MLQLRIALAVCALAVCALFGLGVLQARDQSRASAIIASNAPLTPARAAHVRSLLDTAGTLNPDAGIDLLRADLAFEQNEPARTIRILERIIADEPMNIDAWVALAQAALKHDPSKLNGAIAAIGRLDPSPHRKSS